MTERAHKDLAIRFYSEPESKAYCWHIIEKRWVHVEHPAFIKIDRYKVIPPCHQEVFDAWCEGATVQRLAMTGEAWRDDDDPEFFLRTAYRVKPEPTLVERLDAKNWINVSRDVVDLMSKARDEIERLQKENEPKEGQAFVWVNGYPCGSASVYRNPETANCGARPDRMCRIKVPLEEGRFDE